MTINQLPELVTHDGTPAVPAVYNGTDYKLPLKNVVLTKKVSGTTNTSGNMALGLQNNVVVLAAIRIAGTNGICTPLFNVGVSEWMVHITSAGTNPSAVVSGSETVLVFYMPCDMFDYS